MRKIISFTHATLDGYIDDPHEWSFQYSDEELQDYLLKMTLAADALLLGRITYEGMAQAWPTRGANPFADHVNSASPSTSSPPNWSTPRRGIRPWSSWRDLLDEVSRLKQAEGGDLLIWGTGQLTDALAAAGLFDEYRTPAPPRHQGRRRAPVSPCQHRHRRAPRHQDLWHRRRPPRLPPASVP